MTINFQQVNNNPFVVGQIGGTYSLGVSVGEIEELYELLGYTESEDMASQLLSTAGFSLVGAVPEVVKSVKYRDDVRAAYRIATSVSDNKFEQFNLSNRFEDLLIGETKAYNNANGKTLWGKIKSWWNNSSTSSASKSEVSTAKNTTNMATDGVIHKALGITKNANEVNININGFNVAKKGSPLNAAGITTNMEKVTQELGKLANKSSEVYENIDTTNMKKLSDLNKLKEKKQKKETLPDIEQAAKTSVSNIKTVSKSVAKEAFSGAGIAITAITGLSTELPSIVTAFKESSSEGWAQLGKSAATIAISDVGLSAAGQILGGTLGFAIGGLLGPIGASIGGAIGKVVGSSLGSVLGRKLSSWIFGKSATEKQEEEQIKEQAQTVASSQANLQSLLTQAKTQAAQETDSNKAQKILAKVQSIENKLNTSTLSSSSNTLTNPFVSAT